MNAVVTLPQPPNTGSELTVLPVLLAHETVWGITTLYGSSYVHVYMSMGEHITFSLALANWEWVLSIGVVHGF